MEEVARRAGVGPSTLYRRFAGRAELVAAVVDAYFTDEIEPILRRSLADPDPGRALATVLGDIAGAVVHHRGLLKMVRDSGATGDDDRGDRRPRRR